jgi:hypothetical protein
MGELLKEFDGRGGDRSKNDGTVNSAPTQKRVADAAGISERQRVTAVRVANVSAAECESAVESETPPTVTALAEIGKKALSEKGVSSSASWSSLLAKARAVLNSEFVTPILEGNQSLNDAYDTVRLRAGKDQQRGYPSRRRARQPRPPRPCNALD